MWYQIVMRFQSKDGTHTGKLDCLRKGKKAVKEQIAANRVWLSAKEHIELSCDVIEFEKRFSGQGQ